MAPGDPLQEFLRWCRLKGVVFDGVEIRMTEVCGNGVFATRSFRTDEKIIEVPEELMITAGRVANMDIYSRLLSETKFFPTPFELLTLFFCMEDVESPSYGPYLKMLPTAFTTPSFMGEMVDPTHLPLSVREYWCIQQTDLQKSWQRIKEVVPQITYEKFLWAWHVVNTRCIYVENKPHVSVDNSSGDTLAVVPFVDMLNHDPNALCLATFERYSRKYMVRVSRYIQDGQQVTVCYGPHDNARLWIEYGFRLPNNPHGKVILEHALLIALAKKVGVNVSSQHEEALHEADLPSTLYLSDAGPSWALCVNMKILMLSPSDLKRWRELIYVEKPRAVSDSSVDENEESVIDEQQLIERQTLQKIIRELKQAIVNKMGKSYNCIEECNPTFGVTPGSYFENGSSSLGFLYDQHNSWLDRFAPACFTEDYTPTSICQVPQGIKWIWKEQIMIVDIVLSSFTQ